MINSDVLLASKALVLSFAFRSSEVRRLLSDVDHYVGTHLFGMFLFFLKRTIIIIIYLFIKFIY